MEAVAAAAAAKREDDNIEINIAGAETPKGANSRG